MLERYGGRVSSQWLLPKTLQLLEEALEAYRECGLILEMVDWLSLQLTGRLRRNRCCAGFKSFWVSPVGLFHRPGRTSGGPAPGEAPGGDGSSLGDGGRADAGLGPAAGTYHPYAGERGYYRCPCGCAGQRRDGGGPSGHDSLTCSWVRLPSPLYPCCFNSLPDSISCLNHDLVSSSKLS